MLYAATYKSLRQRWLQVTWLQMAERHLPQTPEFQNTELVISCWFSTTLNSFQWFLFLLLLTLHGLTNTTFHQLSALICHSPSTTIAVHHSQFQEAKLGRIWENHSTETPPQSLQKKDPQVVPAVTLHCNSLQVFPQEKLLFLNGCKVAPWTQTELVFSAEKVDSALYKTLCPYHSIHKSKSGPLHLPCLFKVTKRYVIIQPLSLQVIPLTSMLDANSSASVSRCFLGLSCDFSCKTKFYLSLGLSQHFLRIDLKI